MLKLSSCVIAAALLCPCSASADYPSAKQNAHLAEELKGDPQRLIPVSEHFAFALDGTTAVRALGQKDYFHGINYWLQFRSEARLHEYASLNLRTILYAGSISYGYSRPTGFYNLFGISGELPNLIAGGKFKARALDLNRQTVGAGLLLQETEFNGLLLDWTRDEASLSFRVNGTGPFSYAYDTYVSELSFFQKKIGAGAVFWIPDSESLSRLSPYVYLFSTNQFENYGFDLEVGTRHRSFGGLLALKAQGSMGGLRVKSRIETRRYAKDFAYDLAGEVKQTYVAYDQLNKAYTNAFNVFVTGDDATVVAGHLDLKWAVTPTWYIESLNELGQFYFGSHSNQFYYFYRLGLGYCPISNRDDCLVIFASDKIMTLSYDLPPRGYSNDTVPVFTRQAYWGVEANFKF